MPIIVRAVEERERGQVVELFGVDAGGVPVVTPSGCYDPTTLPALVAIERGEIVAALTYRQGADEVEIITLRSIKQGRGAGTALLAAAREIASRHNSRLWLITTEDNVAARHFYERRGMVVARTHHHFDEVVRQYKPAARLTFSDAIELTD